MPSQTSTHGTRSLVAAGDLSIEEVADLVSVARKCRNVVENTGGSDALKRCVVGLLFLEPSTRTRCSFEVAAKRLGAEVIVVGSAESSVQKGETLEDTVQVLAQYCDLIVIRHPEEGSVARARDVSRVPVVSAGDGIGEHPTQALLDIMTICDCIPGSLNEFTVEKKTKVRIAFVGDMKNGRTVHSLARLLAKLDVDMDFVAPESLQPSKELLDELRRIQGEGSRNVIRVGSSVDEVVKEVDFMYVTRVQQERFTDKAEYEKVKESYEITKDTLKHAQHHLKVLHPLPRINEIARDVDATDHCMYFRQACNGTYIRMAVLLWLLNTDL